MVGVGEGTGVGEGAGVGVSTTVVKVGLGIRVGGMLVGLELELQAARRTVLTTASSVMATKRGERALILSLVVFIVSLWASIL